MGLWAGAHARAIGKLVMKPNTKLESAAITDVTKTKSLLTSVTLSVPLLMPIYCFNFIPSLHVA